MEIKALTITQYLIQGNPDGIVASYISNWTGQALKFPRNLLTVARTTRDEFRRPGIYFLIGQNPNEIDTWRVYVGESEGLDVRLSEHDRDLKKDFWEQAVIFSSKDDNLTKGHVRYLEFRLQDELKQNKRVQLENTNATKPKLPEASIAEMEMYFDFLKLMMPVLGFSFFEQIKISNLGIKLQSLHLSASGLKADGFLTAKGLVVKAGSEIAKAAKPALSGNYNLLRQTLNDQGVIDLVKGKFILDYEFTSPSAAGAVILGYNINGRDHWKTKDGKTVNQLEE